MAKSPKQEPVAVSLNPKDMISAGLKDDFRGKIVEASYAPWDYMGNIEEPVLAAKLTIQEMDDDGADITEGEAEGKITQYWSAGDLAAFAPSLDGKEPTDGEGMELEEGPFLVRVGKRAALNNNTNFAHLMRSVLDSGTAAKKFTEEQLTPSIECLVGLDAHWNRVPQAKRPGLVDDSEKKRSNDVLVVTKVYGYGTAKAAKAVKAKGKPAPPPDDDDEDAIEEDEDTGTEVSPLDQETAEAVLEILGDAPGNKIKKGKLPMAMLKVAAKSKNKSKMVKRCSELDFLGNSELGWQFDEDSGMLWIGAEEE